MSIRKEEGMSNQREAIANLVVFLPMFMGTLLEGKRINTKLRLNYSEKRTLMYIYNHGGRTMTEYSKRVGLARGSFTTVADSLEDKGLVGRVPGADDRRKCMLVLTEAGKEAAREIDSRFKKHIAARLNCLTEEELEDLKNALVTIETTREKLRDRGN